MVLSQHLLQSQVIAAALAHDEPHDLGGGDLGGGDLGGGVVGRGVVGGGVVGGGVVGGGVVGGAPAAPIADAVVVAPQQTLQVGQGEKGGCAWCSWWWWQWWWWWWCACGGGSVL